MRITTLKDHKARLPNKLSVAFQFSADYDRFFNSLTKEKLIIAYQSLSNSVRITTPRSKASPVVLLPPISRFPIQCGLRRSTIICWPIVGLYYQSLSNSVRITTCTLLPLLFLAFPISRFPIQCGLRHCIVWTAFPLVLSSISRFPIQCGLRRF